MEHQELPLGFSFALAQNSTAMRKFASLSEDKQQEIISGAHSVGSKSEMHRYVENIAKAY